MKIFELIEKSDEELKEIVDYDCHGISCNQCKYGHFYNFNDSFMCMTRLAECIFHERNDEKHE